MVTKTLINGQSGDLNNAADGFGAGADNITVPFETTLYSYFISTYKGDDIINVRAAKASDFTIYSGKGKDTILGGATTETVYDGAGDDKVSLKAGNDILNVGSGNDRYDGGAGENDTISFRYMNNNKGTADVTNTNGVTFDLSKISAQNLGVFGIDTVKNFENVGGGAGNDKLYGSSAANNIVGNLGKDYIEGRGGADSLTGGDGKDSLFGGKGADTISLGESKLDKWRDTVLYTSAKQSGIGEEKYDLINFFDAGGGAGNDIIDLSAIDANANKKGDQSFIYREVNSFTSVRGELWVEQLNSSQYLVHIDTDNDAADEMQIFVNASSFDALSKIDFIL